MVRIAAVKLFYDKTFLFVGLRIKKEKATVKENNKVECKVVEGYL